MNLPLIVDCDGCEMRHLACGDCMMTALLGADPAGTHEFSSEEATAMGVLSRSGMVPPLRLVEPIPGGAERQAM